MPLKCVFRISFQKAFDSLSLPQQAATLKTLEELKRHFHSGAASYGLRVKKLFQRSSQKIFEARAGDDLRIVWLQTGEEAIFCLIANHDEVRKFLKNL